MGRSPAGGRVGGVGHLDRLVAGDDRLRPAAMPIRRSRTGRLTDDRSGRTGFLGEGRFGEGEGREAHADGQDDAFHGRFSLVLRDLSQCRPAA